MSLLILTTLKIMYSSLIIVVFDSLYTSSSFYLLFFTLFICRLSLNCPRAVFIHIIEPETIGRIRFTLPNFIQCSCTQCKLPNVSFYYYAVLQFFHTALLLLCVYRRFVYNTVSILHPLSFSFHSNFLTFVSSSLSSLL